MFDDAFAHFEGEIEAGEFKIAVFELFDDAERVKVVVEPAAVGAHEFVELAFSGVAEGRMANVVNERQRLGKFAVEPESSGNGASDLRDFERVGEAVAKMIGIARGENLRFGFKAAEGARMNDAIAVTRVFGAIGMARLGKAAAARKFFAHGQGREWRGVRDSPLRLS